MKKQHSVPQKRSVVWYLTEHEDWWPAKVVEIVKCIDQQGEPFTLVELQLFGVLKSRSGAEITKCFARQHQLMEYSLYRPLHCTSQLAKAVKIADRHQFKCEKQRLVSEAGCMAKQRVGSESASVTEDSLGEYRESVKEYVVRQDRKLIINAIYKTIKANYDMRRSIMKDEAIRMERAIKQNETNRCRYIEEIKQLINTISRKQNLQLESKYRKSTRNY